ncbi:pyridoxal 5'-phosphate synthase glutaminase subunit PdxT [Patescibacteria group bacterium]|nr:pyridoxal 5'-phosphate synthase glutaminase subunit PdxT [Patescibacteria group bacterium]
MKKPQFPSHKIGILAIHGDVAEHAAVLAELNLEAVEVRAAKDFKNLDGLILPGGESTTIYDLAKTYGLISPLRKFIVTPRKNLPTTKYQLPTILATCAGLILLVKFGLLNVEVERNAYGRQLNSFEADLKIPILGSRKFPGIFIRAPKILRTGKGVEILAEFEGAPVFVRQRNIFAASFHPELTDDLRIHKFIFGLKFPQ